MDLISVVIPIYNVEKYLERCIESIVNQSYSNLEIILVNDGSPDNSEDICLKYVEYDKRIKYVKKKNGGLSDARNYGMQHATGEYIAFIDSDDFIDKDYIKILHNNLQSSNADVSICGYLQVKDDAERICIEKCDEEIETFTSREAIYALFDPQYRMQFTTAWGKIYKAQLFHDIKYPFGRKYEDSSIAHLIYSKANKIVYTATKMYFYAYRIGSIKTSDTFKDIDATLANLDRKLFFKEYGDTYLYVQSLKEYLTCLMGVYSRMDKSIVEKKEYLKNEFDVTFRELVACNTQVSFAFKFRVLVFRIFPSVYASMIKINNIYRKWGTNNRVRNN